MTAQHKHPLQTEFEFTLPKGYVDSENNLHKSGTMRLATAADEISPLRDPRVKANQAYLQDFYRQINSEGESSTMTVTCPACEHVFDVETSGPGGS